MDCHAISPFNFSAFKKYMYLHILAFTSDFLYRLTITHKSHVPVCLCFAFAFHFAIVFEVE